jgi:transposase-like protein
VTRKRPALFRGRHFEDVIILLCVRWCLRYSLTYRDLKVAGSWAYLYRAIDSAGETIEFMLSPKRDLIAAKLDLRLALSAGGPPPRVIM